MRNLIFIAFCCVASVTGQIVDTKYGPVQGHPLLLTSGKTVNSFLGVPYAKPPLGDLRWKLPEESEPWEIFIADELRSACIQNLLGSLIFTHPGWTDISEDCLHLNIYSPDEEGPHPVMVYIHGGAYIDSANIQYPGHFLAEQGVVVVVLNYRLGIFGFASTGDDVAPGNYGMHDQVLALKFVQENIAEFGGDPTKVTLFGQSAGAASTGLLMMSPLAEGLFHQAIQLSGSSVTPWAVNQDEVDPHEWIHQDAEQNDCDSDDSVTLMNCCLRQIGPLLLHHTQFNCSYCSGFGPVVDGFFLPDRAENLLETGSFAHLPTIQGVTSDEGHLYLLQWGIGNLTEDSGVSRSEFEYRISRFVDQFDYLYENEQVKDQVYQAILFFYTPWPHSDDEKIIADVGFGAASDSEAKCAKIHSEYADTYFYMFGFRGTNHSQMLPEWTGVPHILDLPYVFGFPLIKENPLVRNDTQMWNDPIDWTEENAQIARFTITLLTNFAKYGDPTPEPVDPPNGSPPVSWGQFSRDDLSYLHLTNDTIEMKENFRQKDFAFWSYYIKDMIRTPGQ